MTQEQTISTLDDLEFLVHFDYDPGYPEVQYLANGDPGYPGEPTTFEIFSIHLFKTEGNGNRLLSPNIMSFLPDSQVKVLLDDLYENWEPTTGDY